MTFAIVAGDDGVLNRAQIQIKQLVQLFPSLSIQLQTEKEKKKKPEPKRTPPIQHYNGKILKCNKS